MQMRKALALLLALVFFAGATMTMAAPKAAEQPAGAVAETAEGETPAEAPAAEEQAKDRPSEDKPSEDKQEEAAKEEPAKEEEAPAKRLPYAVLMEVTTTSLINRDSRLPEGYAPENLVRMKDYNTSGNLRLEKSSIKIHPEAAVALNAMMAGAKADGVKDFILDNAYRSHEKQTAMFQRKLKKNPLYGQDRRIPLTTAIPGASEHEAGLAIDICGKKHTNMNEKFGESVYGRWLAANSYKYGYILRYPKGKEQITGIAYEPWHYRYVGQELAIKLYQKGWTLEEYYEDLAKQERKAGVSNRRR